jgi:nitric oxide reductase subunit B
MSASEAPAQDRVTKVLIIVLLLVTAVAWLAMAWMTILTYQGALPLLRHMVSASGAALMTREDLVAGKAGFQKADLMDYGSLQCMGSYFGEDYTASVLVALARQTQASVEDRDRMREMLRGIDLRAEPVVVPDAVAGVIVKVRGFLARRLREDDYAAGYSKAHSLEPAEAKAVANFVIYSALSWSPLGD